MGIQPKASPQTAQAKQQAAPSFRKEGRKRSLLLETRTFATFKRKLNASCLLTKMYFFFCSTIPCIKTLKISIKMGWYPISSTLKKKKKKKKGGGPPYQKKKKKKKKKS